MIDVPDACTSRAVGSAYIHRTKSLFWPGCRISLKFTVVHKRTSILVYRRTNEHNVPCSVPTLFFQTMPYQRPSKGEVALTVHEQNHKLGKRHASHHQKKTHKHKRKSFIHSHLRERHHEIFDVIDK